MPAINLHRIEVARDEPSMADQPRVISNAARAQQIAEIMRIASTDPMLGKPITQSLLGLARSELNPGSVTPLQRQQAHQIASVFNANASQALGVGTQFLSADELEMSLSQRDGGELVVSAMNRFIQWADQLPVEKRDQVHAALELSKGNLSLSEVQAALSESEQENQSEGLMGWGLLAAVLLAYAGLTHILGLIANLFSGDEHEDRLETLADGLVMHRHSYCHVPWKGFDFGGKNSQYFEDMYFVESKNDQPFETIEITFRTAFEGSGVDKLRYPLTCSAVDTDGVLVSPTLETIKATSYDQRHRAVLQNVGMVVFSVKGYVEYGADGILTAVAMIPRGKVRRDGQAYDFGGDDSIWQHGVSA